MEHPSKHEMYATVMHLYDAAVKMRKMAVRVALCRGGDQAQPEKGPALAPLAWDASSWSITIAWRWVTSAGTSAAWPMWAGSRFSQGPTGQVALRNISRRPAQYQVGFTLIGNTAAALRAGPGKIRAGRGASNRLWEGTTPWCRPCRSRPPRVANVSGPGTTSSPGPRPSALSGPRWARKTRSRLGARSGRGRSRASSFSSIGLAPREAGRSTEARRRRAGTWAPPSPILPPH
jgi:hypothetical protein